MKTVNANSGKLKACWWAHNNYCIFSVWNAFLFKPNWEMRPKQKHFIPSEYATENGPAWKWAPLFCDSIVDKALLFGLLWLDSLSGDTQNRLLSLFYMHRQLLHKPSFLLCRAALVGQIYYCTAVFPLGLVWDYCLETLKDKTLVPFCGVLFVFVVMINVIFFSFPSKLFFFTPMWCSQLTGH